jgi:hypothetical protein
MCEWVSSPVSRTFRFRAASLGGVSSSASASTTSLRSDGRASNRAPVGRCPGCGHSGHSGCPGMMGVDRLSRGIKISNPPVAAHSSAFYNVYKLVAICRRPYIRGSGCYTGRQLALPVMVSLEASGGAC